MQTALKRWLPTLAMTALLAAPLGCSTGRDPATGNADLGTISVPLTASSPSNVSYHLANAIFVVTGPTNTVLFGDTPTLQQDLQPGGYTIQLLDGWTLSAIDPDGSERPVAGTLLSSAFQFFNIRAQRTTTVTYQFKVSEVVVTTGDGTVAVTVSVDDTSIDDFEDGDGNLSPIGGRNGAWFTFNDGTGTQTPAPGTPIVPEVDSNANLLLHSTGRGFVASSGSSFGAGVGATFKDDATGLAVPYDASGYTGVSFTFSVSSSFFFATQVRFNVATAATTPVEFGGTCTSGCNDDFGVFLFPSSFPQTVSFRFTDLFQQGFGTPATFDATTLVNLKWNLSFTSQPGDFDFTLDNVSFTH